MSRSMLLVILLLAGCNSPTTLKKTYYPDGQLKSEIPYRGELAHGVKRDWYPNGQLRMERKFTRGFLVAEKKWYPSGQIANEGNYTKDALDGKWRWSDEQGHLVAEGFYRRNWPWSGTVHGWIEDASGTTQPVLGWGEYDNGRLIRQVSIPLTPL